MSLRTLTTMLILCLTLTFFGGCISIIPMGGMPGMPLHETEVQPAKGWTAKKVLMIPLDGMLTDFESRSLFYRQENAVTELRRRLDIALHDGQVYGIVLRVNSPGGTLTASDLLYRAIKEFKENFRKEQGREIPVVTIFTDLGASGAYYLACACDAIVAHPTAITGSVGVIFQSYNIEGTLKLIGVKPMVFASGDKKDIGSPYRDMETDEKEILREMIHENRLGFLRIVQESRGEKLEKTLREKLETYLRNEDKGYLADGRIKDILSGTALDSRILSAKQALAAGIVDEIGYFDTALDIIRKKANIRDFRVVAFDSAYSQTTDIYANTSVPQPNAQRSQEAFSLTAFQEFLQIQRPGFYYLWKPGCSGE